MSKLYELEKEQDENDDTAVVQASDSNKPATGGDETHCGRARAVAGAMEGTIAQLGNEVFILSAGKWHKQTGHICRAMLRWWGSDPTKTGLWGASLKEWAVDPNHEAQSVYFERAPGDDWRPIRADVRDVYLANGRYNVVDRTFTPRELKKLIFGPVIHQDYNADILAACREGNFTDSPAQFRVLLGMIAYALENDEPTVKYFQSVVGQILRPHAGFNQFVHVFGESGARKTTILRALLSAPCGVNGYNEISEAVLAEQKFTRAGLVNRIANLSNDSATTSRFVPFIKEITSGILISEKKFHDAAPVRMTAKLYATMNVPQRYDDDSLGIENRLIVFKFKERTDNNRSAAGMEWMDSSFYTDETRKWITHWMIVGLENCVKNGAEEVPEVPPVAKAWKEALLNDALPTRRFVQEFLERDKKSFVSTNLLIDTAIEHGYCPPDERSRANFGEKMASLVKYRFGISKRRRTVDGKKLMVFDGLRTKEGVQ